MSDTSVSRYPTLLRLSHWMMALVIIGLIISGLYMADLPRDAANRSDFYHWHKSFGALMMLAIFIRLFIRVRSLVPAPPAVLKPWERKASHAGHHSLYLLMLLVPASGWLMSATYNGSPGINFFWTTLPGLFPHSESLFQLGKALHAPLGYAIAAVVVVHIAAVIKHRFFDKPEADVLPRMLP